MDADHLARAWAARRPVPALRLRPAELAALVEDLKGLPREETAMMSDPYGPINLSDILGNTAPCPRCGALCRIPDAKPSEEARIARYGTREGVERGTAMCLACAFSGWLQQSPLADLITVEKLRDPRVQRHMRELYDSAPGHNDGSSAEIDWAALIANWDLPFPKPKRKRYVSEQV